MNRPTSRRDPRPLLQPRRLAQALAACSLLTLWPLAAQLQTLPSGLNVAAGQAQVSQQGQAMTVRNSAGAILNWQSFSIGANASVRFEQPDAMSSVLNRVLGRDPSSILGSLSSNGRVWLMNPNGVLFGANARVDVAGLVTSTLRINDSDWLAGRFNLLGDANSTASIVNQGELRTSLGGRIALVGANVRNEGLIEAPGGQVLLAAGSSVELVDTGAPNLGVKLSAGGEALNLGTLKAAGGRIDIHAAAVNQQGIVNASNIEQGPGGQIEIRASGRLTQQGTIEAKADQGHGGSVQLFGKEIALIGPSTVDASGSQGGGEVLVGGGLKGQDSRYPNASGLFFGPQASIRADATDKGDGGRIILWSNQATRAYGSLSAVGGVNGGNGGFIETSGGWLDARPAKIDVTAAKGQAGTWLIDPFDILIVDGDGNSVIDQNMTGGPLFEPFDTPAVLTTQTIAQNLNLGTSVIVDTASSGGGDITVSGATISVSSATPGSLTLRADGQIFLSSSDIVSTGGPMDVSLLAGRSSSVGGIYITNSGISSNGGNILVGGFVSNGIVTNAARNDNGSSAVTVSLANLDAGSGNIAIHGFENGSFGPGVAALRIDDSIVSSRTINLTGVSVANAGIRIQGGSTITASRRLNLIGLTNALEDFGVRIMNGSVLRVQPASFDSAAQLYLQGGNTAGGTGVLLASQGPAQVLPQLILSNGAGLDLYAEALNQNQGSGYEALRVSGTFSPQTVINASAGASYVNVQANGNADLFAAAITGGPSTWISVGATGLLALDNTTINTGGQIQIGAQDIDLLGSTVLSSTATSGTSIFIGGGTTGGGSVLPNLRFDSFYNFTNAGAGALVTSPGARWIAWGTTIGEGEGAQFFAGGLNNAFTRWGATSAGQFANDAGNGFVFSEARQATIAGSVQTRVYDGTRTASVGGLSITDPVIPSTGALRSGVGLRFVTRFAGSGKGVEFFDTSSGLTTPDALVFTEGGKPVYGYSYNLAGLTGTVTPAPVTATGLAVASRAYNGSLGATLTGTASLNGVFSIDLGGVSLGGTMSGVFADKNVGTNKPVAVSGLTLSGPNAVNYSLLPVTGLVGTITPAQAVVTGLQALNKVYDGTVVAALGGTAQVQVIGGDQVSLSGSASGVFGDKNVGSNKPVSVDLSSLSLTGADAGNYQLASNQQLSASITPRALVVSGLVANNKVYDGTTAATLTGTLSTNALAGDQVSFGGNASASFSDKNAGTGKSVTVTGLTLSGADAGNYSVQLPSGLTADITRRPVSFTGLVADNKVYDATTTANVRVAAGQTLSASVLPGDVVSVSGTPSGSFADKNVGSAKPVNVTGLSLSGADASNYTLQGALSADISPLAVSVSGLTAANKTYDGSTSASLSGSASVAVLGNDSVSVTGSASASFADKNVGNGKPVSVSGLALSGTDAANYTLLPLTGLSANITPLAIGITGLVADNKVYDGSTSANVRGTALAQSLPGDSVSVQGNVFGSFGDKNVGNAKPVAVGGLSLAGADAANYSLLPPTLSANITALGLNVTGLLATSRIYDGSTTVAITGTPVVSPRGSDRVSVGGSPIGTLADKNVGNNKPVSVSGLVLSGADAGNYSLLPISGVTASISARSISISGLTVATRQYNASTNATLTGNPALQGLIGSDIVSVAGSASASFADKNVGSNKPVSASGYSLAGADAGNYTLLPISGLSGSITAAPLSVTGLSAADKVYDGNTNASITGSARVSPLGSDAVAVGGSASGSFADRNVGSNKAVSVTGLSLSGADAGNYSLVLPTLRAGITPATLTYVADPRTALLGQPITGLTGNVTGLLGGDTLATATSGSLLFTTNATAASGLGQYAINGSGLTAANYSFVQAAGNATALNIVGLPPQTKAEAGVNQGLAPIQQALAIPVVTVNPATSGLVDISTPSSSGAGAASSSSSSAGSGAAATAATAAAASAAPAAAGSSGSFAPVRLDALSPEAIQTLLVARQNYKSTIFAEAVNRLQANPRLADLQACVRLKDAQDGTCLVTESQRNELRALYERQAVVAPTPAPTAAPTAAPTPAPTTPPTAVAQPAPAAPAPAAPAAAPAAVPAAAPAPVPVLSPERRRVLNAALPQIERKVALVIGVDNYKDTAIPTLANAVRDARAMARTFEAELGYETVVLENASKSTVVAALNRLALELRPRDSVVVYYAGHGELIESTKLGYWQLADADSKRPETWLSNSDISRLVAAIPASQVALVSDSCYSGSLVTEERIRASNAPVDPVALLTRKTVVVMSSGGNEPVFDAGKDGHSPFAYSLMNTLRQVNDWRPGGQIFERVRFAVARELPQRPQYGASSAAGHQAGGDYLFEQRRLETR